MEITQSTLTSTEVPIDFRAEAKELSKVLYKELRSLCAEGEPLSVVKNLITDHRGAEV